MNDHSNPARDEKIQRARKAPSDGGELLPRPSSTISASGEKCDSPKPALQGVYLWLCCEGWMRFGPYEWLRFDDKESAILDPRGETVAWRADGGWRTSSPRGEGMVFSNPTITISSEHPHRNSGSSPARRARFSIEP